METYVRSKGVTAVDVRVLTRPAADPSRAVRQLHPTKKQGKRSPTLDSSSSEYILSDTEPIQPEEDTVCEADDTSNADETMSFAQGDYVFINVQTRKHHFHYVEIMEKRICNDTWSINHLRSKHSGDSKHYYFDKPSNPDVLKTNLHIIKKLPKPSFVNNEIILSVSLFTGLVVRHSPNLCLNVFLWCGPTCPKAWCKWGRMFELMYLHIYDMQKDFVTATDSHSSVLLIQEIKLSKRKLYFNIDKKNNNSKKRVHFPLSTVHHWPVTHFSRPHLLQ